MSYPINGCIKITPEWRTIIRFLIGHSWVKVKSKYIVLTCFMLVIVTLSFFNFGRFNVYVKIYLIYVRLYFFLPSSFFFFLPLVYLISRASDLSIYLCLFLPSTNVKVVPYKGVRRNRDNLNVSTLVILSIKIRGTIPFDLSYLSYSSDIILSFYTLGLKT